MAKELIIAQAQLEELQFQRNLAGDRAVQLAAQVAHLKMENQELRNQIEKLVKEEDDG